MSARSGRGRKGSRRGTLAILVRRATGAVALLAAAAGLLGYLADRHWALDLLSHFRLQYALLLLVATAVFLLLRRPVRAGLVVAGAVAAGAPLAAYRLVDEVGCPAGRTELRALSLHVRTDDRDRSAVVEWIRRQGADVVFLMEVDDGWRETLEGTLAADYPHRVMETREDDFGVAVLSRIPLLEGRVTFFATSQPSVVVRLALPTGPWTVVGTHPSAPDGEDGTHRRDLQLDALAARVRAAREPTLVLGDLNTTPWSASFPAFLASARLRDSGEGGWAPGTWGGPVAPLRIPIDHALLSEELCRVERHVGPDVGSDHRPLEVAVARR